MNNYAISTSDLADSLTRSSAALVAANNSLEESIAMTAAANTTIQDPESVGNALKTVSMRIRGVKSELEEAGEETEGMVTNTAKLQEKIMALTNIDNSGGINILTNTGEFKSTYEILLAISKVWKDMDDVSQAALLETIAGKTRGSVVAALFQNGDVLEDAYKSATGASGSAMNELNTHLDSIQGRIDLFNNSLQTMWMNFIDSDVIKFIVDIGTGLIKTADKVGLFNVALVALIATLSRKQLIDGLKNLFKPGTKNIQGFIKHIGTLIAKTKEVTVTTVAEALSSKGVAAARVGEILVSTQLAGVDGQLSKEKIKVAAATLSEEFASKKLTASQYLAAMSSMGLKTALQGLWNVLKANPVILISTLVMAAAKAFDYFHTTAVESMEKTKEAFEEMRSVVESTKSTIQSLESELTSIEEQLDSFDGKQLSFADEQEVDRLKKQRSELQKNLDMQNEMLKLQQENSNKKAIAAVKAYTKASSEGAKETRNNWQNWAKWGVAAVTTVAAAVVTGGASLAVQLGSMAAAGIAGYAVGNVAGEAIGSSVTENKGSYDSWYKTYTDAIETARAKEQEALEAYQKDTSNMKKLDKWQEMQQKTMDIESEMYEHISKMQSYFTDAEYGQSEEMDKALDEWYAFQDKFLIDHGSQDAAKNALDRLFGENANDVVKAYRDKIKNDIENGESVDFQEMIDVTGLDDDLEALGLTTKDVVNYFTQLGEAGSDAIEKIDVSDLISELAKVEGVLESVQSVMEEFRTDGIVSASTLDGMDENIKGLGEAWENYVGTMMSGTATMADAKVATEELAKAYLEQNINNLKDNRLTYIAQLEKFGNIENAAELVDSYINNSFWNSSEFENFKGNAEELVELAKEYGVTIEDVSKVEDLLTAKEEARYNKSKRATQLAERNTVIYNRDFGDKNRADEYHNALGTGESGEAWWILHDALNKTGQYASMAEDELNEIIDHNLFIISSYLKSLPQYINTDITLEDLFPSLTKEYIVPEITVSQAEVDKAEKEYQDQLNKMDLTVTPRIDMNPADTIQEISDIESGFEALSSAYNEFLEEGVASAGTLAGLKDTFDVVGMKDEYAKFVTTLGNSNSTIEQVKAALLDLANVYLNTIDITDQLDESEKQMIIEQLTRLGVENAAEWVNARINAYREILKAYQIDLNNYNSAEEAKAATAIATALGIESLNDDLVRNLMKEYESDLNGFTSTEASKVEAAKDAAKKIAKAHLEAASMAEYNATVASLDVINNADDLRKEQNLARKMKNGVYAEGALKAYNDAVARINSMGTIDPNDYIGSWFGNDANIDWGQFEDIGDGSGSDSDTELDWLDHYFTEIENEIKKKEAELENVVSSDTDTLSAKNTIIDEIIDLYKKKMSPLETAMNAYNDRASTLLAGFSSDIQGKILDGSIDINEYDGDLAEDIQNYFDYITKASDLEVEISGITATITDLNIQQIDNAYDRGSILAAIEASQTEKLQNAVDLDEAKGLITDPSYYAAMMENSSKTVEYLTKARNDMQKEFDDMLADGLLTNKDGSYNNKFYEELDKLYKIDSEIAKATIELENFQNSINDIYWESFDEGINRIDYLSEEAQSLIDLMSNEDMIIKPDSEDGWGSDDVQWSDVGLATLGLHTQNMERAEEKAKWYGQAINDLTAEYEAGHYSESEYYEKLNELTKGQYDAIKAAQDEKDAIVELNKQRVDAIKEGIEKEIEAYEELIEKKKEELSAEKDLYDFQKSTVKQQKNIADIERQLSALANDNSMSATAKRRQLEAELAEAKAELEDSYYNRSIDNQQEALDKELDNFKEQKDAEIEQWDKYLEDIENIVAESLGIVKSKSEEIGGILVEKSGEYNTTLSSAILDPWKDGLGAIDDYTKKIGDSVSPTVQALEPLREKWQKIKEELAAANAEADKYYNKDKSTADGKSVADINAENKDYYTPDVANQQTKTTTLSQATTQTQTPKQEETKPSLTVGSYIDVKPDTKWYADSSGGGSWGWARSGTIKYINTNGSHAYNIDGLGWVKKTDIKGYYKGTTGVDKNQIARIDELGEEIVMHAQNGKLAYLTKGSAVIPHDISENLMQLGQLDPSNVLNQNRPSIGVHPEIHNTEINLSITYGDMVSIGEYNGGDIKDLEKMVAKQFEKHTRDLNNAIRKYVR